MTSKQMMEEARALQETLVVNRRYLHTHAETGFDLKDTLAYVKKKLQDMGYQPMECGKAGLVALAGGKKPGKVFLIRGDMDALPIREETGVEFACGNGNMHACGHDCHTSMMLGAARLLKAHEDEIEGTVKLMFQPAEEIFEGSYDMLKHGVLENPQVDAAMMIHVVAAAPFPTGTVIVSAPGISALAADYFEIRVQGKGCHGSMPQAGVDPLNAAAHILIALQELSARELSMDDQAVLTIGTMHAGIASNVIPDTVVMGGSLRTYDEEVRSFLKERMEQIVTCTAQAFRAEAKVAFGSGCPALRNDADLSQCADIYVKELLEPGKALSVVELNARSGSKAIKSAGSEDFAYVSQQVPSIMLSLAAGEPDQGYVYPQHHPKVTFDEAVLVPGSAVYAYTAMRWLEEHG